MSSRRLAASAVVLVGLGAAGLGVSGSAIATPAGSARSVHTKCTGGEENAVYGGLITHQHRDTLSFTVKTGISGRQWTYRLLDAGKLIKHGQHKTQGPDGYFNVEASVPKSHEHHMFVFTACHGKNDMCRETID